MSGDASFHSDVPVGMACNDGLPVMPLLFTFPVVAPVGVACVDDAFVAFPPFASLEVA